MLQDLQHEDMCIVKILQHENRCTVQILQHENRYIKTSDYLKLTDIQGMLKK